MARELAKLPPPAPQQAQALELTEEDEGRAAVLFLALGTQWKVAGMTGVALGLDYAAIEPTARMLGMDMTPQIFVDLREMEREALQVMTAKAARK